MYLVNTLQCTKADLGNGKLRAVARYRERQRERQIENDRGTGTFRETNRYRKRERQIKVKLDIESQVTYKDKPVEKETEGG